MLPCEKHWLKPSLAIIITNQAQYFKIVVYKARKRSLLMKSVSFWGKYWIFFENLKKLNARLYYSYAFMSTPTLPSGWFEPLTGLFLVSRVASIQLFSNVQLMNSLILPECNKMLCHSLMLLKTYLEPFPSASAGSMFEELSQLNLNVRDFVALVCLQGSLCKYAWTFSLIKRFGFLCENLLFFQTEEFCFDSKS